MTECLACREEGQSAPATYIVTLYVASGEERVQSSCDVHAMVLVVTAIAQRHGVWAMTASRRNLPAVAGPGGGTTTAAGGNLPGAVARPRVWFGALSRAYRRIRRALGPSGT